MAKQHGEETRLDRFMGGALAVGGLASGGLALFLLFQDRPASATVAVAFSLGLVVLRSGAAELVKVAGFEVRFQRKIEEVEKVARQLREMSIVLADIGFRQASYGGFFGGVPPSALRGDVEKVHKTLREIGVPADRIGDASRGVIRAATWKMICTVAEDLRAAREAMAKRLDRERAQFLRDFPGTPYPREGDRERLSARPKQIRAEDRVAWSTELAIDPDGIIERVLEGFADMASPEARRALFAVLADTIRDCHRIENLNEEACAYLVRDRPDAPESAIWSATERVLATMEAG